MTSRLRIPAGALHHLTYNTRDRRCPVRRDRHDASTFQSRHEPEHCGCQGWSGGRCLALLMDSNSLSCSAFSWRAGALSLIVLACTSSLSESRPAAVTQACHTMSPSRLRGSRCGSCPWQPSVFRRTGTNSRCADRARARPNRSGALRCVRWSLEFEGSPTQPYSSPAS